MLVLAVAVLVAENLGGGVRLIPANPKRYTDIANLRGNVGVQRADLLLVRRLAGDQLRNLGLNLGAGHSAVALQSAIPTAHLFPRFEGRPRNRRQLALLGIQLLIGRPHCFLLRLRCGLSRFTGAWF